MNEPIDSEDLPDDYDQQVEMYLDGLLNVEEVENLMENMSQSDALHKHEKLQDRINESLGALFTFEPLSVDSILGNTEVSSKARTVDGSPQLDSAVLDAAPNVSAWSHRGNLIKLALAAMLFIATGVVLWNSNFLSGPVDPFFEQRAVAQVYLETVADGFEPYYYCDDQQRFADTFEKRQGQPLRLNDLPPGSEMLGLSYLGGIDSESTGMLCLVDGEKVIVFVGKQEYDQPAVLSENVDDSLNVFSETKRGLVFYEVTPLAEATMIKHFAFPEPENDQAD